MKRKFGFLAVCCVTMAFLLASCGGGGGGGGDDPTPKTGIVSGIITDSNNAPVSGASVMIAGASRSVTTSADGSFHIDNLAYGQYEITISKDANTFCATTFSLGGDSLSLGTLRPTSQYPPLDTITPPAPALSIQNTANNTAFLTWTTVTDPSGISKYLLFRDGVAIGEAKGVNSYSDSNRPFDTDESYTVKAVDGAGNISDSSNAVVVRFANTNVNQPPVAVIAVERIFVDREATFDASTSFDPDGTVVSYEWCLNSTCSIRRSGAVVKYTYLSSENWKSGTTTIALTVKDDQGKEARIIQQITLEYPATIYYKDFDEDGYSDGVTREYLDGQLVDRGWKLPNELIATSGDCADDKYYAHPGALETCYLQSRWGGDLNCDKVVTVPCKPLTTVEPDGKTIWFDIRPEDGTLAGVDERVKVEDVVGVRIWTPELEGHCGWNSNDSLGCEYDPPAQDFAYAGPPNGSLVWYQRWKISTSWGNGLVQPMLIHFSTRRVRNLRLSGEGL